MSGENLVAAVQFELRLAKRLSEVAIKAEQCPRKSNVQAGKHNDYVAIRVRRWLAQPLKLVAVLSATLALALLVLTGVEWLMRGSMPSMLQFFSLLHRPLWTTLALLLLIILLLDAVLGRLWQSLLIIAPVLLALAWCSQQKGMYLGDPIYPSDLLYTRQVIDLLPLLVRDRPLDAVLMVVGLIVGLGGLIWLWRIWCKTMPRLSWRGRVARLAVAAPMLIWFGSISDYAQFSYLRDRLGIVPMMWDQKENYAHNGMVVAFIFNIPMANVSAPNGYSQERIDSVAEYLFPEEEVQPMQVALSRSQTRPDIIIIMSESFWDPTRLPGVNFDEDPIRTVRDNQSGHVFSPEFGGMTANVEFEALTGFTNAFLPYGSIPYQQYIRRPVPTLASFFRDQGYATRALHPYREWFWNRSTVYQNFGFEQFLSEENLPTLTKRGNLASDEEFVSEIIRAAEGTDQPLFLFGVSLQGHGPYAPSRYPDSAITVSSDTVPELDDQSIGTIRSFAQGAKDADQSLKRLMDWAKTRERETIIVFFGDHLPPLGSVYTETGFMQNRVASRIDSADQMLAQHETPLMLWSSRSDVVRGVGTISPSFLPYYVLDMAGLTHPYYTGFLGRLHQEYRVIDGHLLLDKAYSPISGWLQQSALPVMLQDYRQVQYDMLFGRAYAQKDFFPLVSDGLYSAAGRPTNAAGLKDESQSVTKQHSTQ